MSLIKQIIIEYFECDSIVLNCPEVINSSIIGACRRSGSQFEESTIHHFTPFGVSGIAVMSGDSHISIHTWPEYGFASVDFLQGGDLIDPWLGLEQLGKDLKSTRRSVHEFRRGLKEMGVGGTQVNVNGTEMQISQISKKREYIFKDLFGDPEFGVVMKIIGKPILTVESPFQKVQIVEAVEDGKLLLIDNLLNISDNTEFVYHEMMIHPSMLVHPDPKNVLVIGGGDGGCIREIFKHKGVQRVVMVDIDQTVIDVCKIHFPAVASQFANPKLELLIADGIEYVKNSPNEQFDVIIVDSTDTYEGYDGASNVIFTHAFYMECKRILRPRGIMVTQAESTQCMLTEFKSCFEKYYKLFSPKEVFAYNAPCVDMLGGQCFSFCSKGGLHPYKDLDRVRIDNFVTQSELKFYDYDIHIGAFALPKKVINILTQLKKE